MNSDNNNKKNNGNRNNNNTRAMVEAALVSVLAVVLILAIKQVPILNYILFVVPSVFALVWVRRGRKYGALSVIVAFLIALILGFIMESVFILVYGGCVSALMSELIIRNRRTSLVIFAGTIGAFIALFVMLYFMQLIAGVSFNEIVTQSMNETKQVFAGMDSEAFKDVNVNEQIDIMEYSLRQFLPSIMFFCSIIVAAVNYATMRWAFRRFLNKKIRRDYLRNFCVPNNLMYGIFFMMVSSWILKKLSLDPTGAVWDNILALSFFALFIQGIAVVAFVAHKNKWSKVMKIMVIAFCVIFISLSQLALVFIGSIDVIFNIRKKMESRANSNGNDGR